MKIVVKKKMEVTKEEFFDYLKLVLLKELKHSVSKKIVKADLVEGYGFNRQVRLHDNKYVTKCKLVELNDYAYHLQVDNGANVQHIVHRIKELDDGRIEDTYEEYIESTKFWVRVQYVADRGKIKSKMRDTLNKFEIQIKGRR